MHAIELLTKTSDFLKKKGIASPRPEAEILVAKALKCQRIDIYANFDKPVGESEKEQLRSYLKRRLGGEPLQYITGEQQFRFLNLKIKKGVFIPRPETELIVDLALNLLSKRKVTILEIGTGTGAIALSLAKEGNFIVTATDMDPLAVSLAKENAKCLGIDVTILQSSLFEGLASQRFDLIISNPPYISEETKLPLDVMAEPERALFAGKEGLDVIKKIIKQSREFLKKNGFLIIEISPEQVNGAKQLAEEQYRVSFKEDLAGKTRFLVASCK